MIHGADRPSCSLCPIKEIDRSCKEGSRRIEGRDAALIRCRRRPLSQQPSPCNYRLLQKETAALLRAASH